jgi:hypothetical protein
MGAPEHHGECRVLAHQLLVRDELLIAEPVPVLSSAGKGSAVNYLATLGLIESLASCGG